MPASTNTSPPYQQSRPTIPATKLGLWMAIFVLVGVPLVALVWDALNRLVAGEIHRVLLPAGLAALALLLVLLRILARTLSRWDHLPQERDDADDA